MSHRDYTAGREIDRIRHENGWPFYALIQAAMRGADTDNLDRLRAAWPEVWQDLTSRYDAPGGFLTDDERFIHDSEQKMRQWQERR